MKKFIQTLSLSLLIASQAMAAMPKKIVIWGTLEKLYKNVATIKTETGTIQVPQKSIVGAQQLGQPVRAEVTFQAIKQLNG